MNARLAPCFSWSYQEARNKFLKAARECGGATASEVHPAALGEHGEPLAIDTALLGKRDAASLLIITSGTHGAEGFAGSGCQVALMSDRDLLARLDRAGIALLLVHALNPHGFSHQRRVNEDNVDLNRNFLRFGEPLPANPDYAEVHGLLLPEEWPPTRENQAAIGAYIAKRGARAAQRIVTTGQSTHPQGLFYSGTAPTWSNQSLRKILRAAGAKRARIGWIDLHTGLGPAGHGEKIFAGRDDAADLARARKWWGADVVSPYSGESASEEVRGPAAMCAHDECAQAEITLMALEFGTVPYEAVLNALRADHWLHAHPEASPALRKKIRQGLLEAFYVDSDEWRGMVAAQSRVAVLQGFAALSG